MLDQLTLGIRLRDEASFESFFTGDNEEIFSILKSWEDSSTWNYIYLCGNAHVGKSHLLQACCQQAGLHQLSAFYLPLSAEFNPLILENLDSFSLICIDNVEYIAGSRLWEEALFHFFNKTIQNKTRLLIAGEDLPSQLSFELPDLVSRLASGVTYQIKPLDDRQKLSALQLRARIRGINLHEEVGQYLLNHYPRNMAALFELLDLLDQASLEAKHRLTIPFIKSILQKT